MRLIPIEYYLLNLKDFFGRMQPGYLPRDQVLTGLRKMAGADFGDTYVEWESWAREKYPKEARRVREMLQERDLLE